MKEQTLKAPRIISDVAQRTSKSFSVSALSLGLAATVLASSFPAPALAQEPATQTLVSIQGADARAPLYRRTTHRLRPVATKSVAEQDNDGRRRIISSASPVAGWAQDERNDIATVAETAIKFDMSALDRPDIKVLSAVLHFDERANSWRSGTGSPQLKAGCVAHLGIATTDWDRQPVSSLFPNDRFATASTGSSRSWNVTSFVKRQLASPKSESLRYGYVLQGAMPLNNLNNDDGTSCLSDLNNIRLDFDLEIADKPAQQTGPVSPGPAPKPIKPDLAVTRVTGPSALAIGGTATYEIAIFNSGAPIKNAPLLQINRLEGIQIDQAVAATNNGITCQVNSLGIGCTGSIGGDNDPMATRSAVIRVQVTGIKAGATHLIASANHARTFEEVTVDNNLKLFEVTVR